MYYIRDKIQSEQHESLYPQLLHTASRPPGIPYISKLQLGQGRRL